MDWAGLDGLVLIGFDGTRLVVGFVGLDCIRSCGVEFVGVLDRIALDRTGLLWVWLNSGRCQSATALAWLLVVLLLVMVLLFEISVVKMVVVFVLLVLVVVMGGNGGVTVLLLLMLTSKLTS